MLYRPHHHRMGPPTLSDSEKYVTPKVAQPYWVKHAYEILVETAGRYNAVITYSELAEEVQRRSSLFTSSQMRNWIGALLADLVKVNHARDEPALTALVVRKDDGQVGAGYDEVLRASGHPAIADPLEREMHAAAARLECYRHWGADVPAGAQPTLTTRTREVRARTVSWRRPCRARARTATENTPNPPSSGCGPRAEQPPRALTDSHGPVLSHLSAEPRPHVLNQTVARSGPVNRLRSPTCPSSRASSRKWNPTSGPFARSTLSSRLPSSA